MPLSGDTIQRTFTHEYDWANGTYRRTGPDGVETFVQYDEANRVTSFRRGPESGDGPVMTAEYTYFADDRVESVTYGNGSSIHYEYDDARRLTLIDHRDDTGKEGTTFLKLEYEYTPEGLPSQITESDASEVTAVVEFSYDARHRLIAEVRTADDPDTDLTYQYDQGGNRTKKTDAVNEIDVNYTYDVDFFLSQCVIASTMTM